MSRIIQFLLYCSGAHVNSLKRTPTEINKFVGIGGTILFTAIFAFISSSYALYTVFNNMLTAILFGIIWALMIFNLDRYIVLSIRNNGNLMNDLMIGSPRIIIAVFLAIVISKPLELKIFEKEIDIELASMSQEIKTKQEQLAKDRFTSQISFHQKAIQSLKEELTLKEKHRNQLEQQAIAEADGTGGSGKKNLGPIYKTKKAAADKVNHELFQLKKEYQPLINEHESAIKELLSKQNETISSLPAIGYNGLAARIEALTRLSSKSNAIALASWFVLLLFICIETAPVLVKLISNKGPYDYKIATHEYSFKMNHIKQTTKQFENTKNKVKFYKEVYSYRLNKEIEAEKESINRTINKRVGKMS